MPTRDRDFPFLPARAAAGEQAAREAAPDALPEWNLADLYAAMDAPELVRDLDRVAADAITFESEWKGRLEEAAREPASGDLGRALRAYESIEELMGRIGSYAGLLYAGDTSNPVHAKFYGDVQQKLTDASAHILFFTLELNRIDDALVDAALDADPVFGRYRPWVVDLRKDKPFSSRSGSSSSSMKSPSPAAPPGTGCSTRR